MADSKLSDLTADTNPAASDLMYKADSAGTSGTDRKVALNLVGGWAVIGQTILGADTASVVFSSIPATYQHLRLVVQARSARVATTDSLALRMNADTAANYEYEQFYGNNATTNVGGAVAQASINGLVPGASASASYGGSLDVTIFDYARTSFYKEINGLNGLGTTNTAAGQWAGVLTGRWKSTSAVTSVTVLALLGNLVAGSTFTLYGLRGA